MVKNSQWHSHCRYGLQCRNRNSNGDSSALESPKFLRVSCNISDLGQNITNHSKSRDSTTEKTHSPWAFGDMMLSSPMTQGASNCFLPKKLSSTDILREVNDFLAVATEAALIPAEVDELKEFFPTANANADPVWGVVDRAEARNRSELRVMFVLVHFMCCCKEFVRATFSGRCTILQYYAAGIIPHGKWFLPGAASEPCWRHHRVMFSWMLLMRVSPKIFFVHIAAKPRYVFCLQIHWVTMNTTSLFQKQIDYFLFSNIFLNFRFHVNPPENVEFVIQLSPNLRQQQLLYLT